MWSMTPPLLLPPPLPLLLLLLLLLFSPKDMFIDFRKRGREGEREGDKHQRERKHQLVASHILPYQGPNLQPGHVSQPEIEPTTFQFMG